MSNTATARIIPRLHFAARSIQPGVFCESQDNDGHIHIHELTMQEAQSLQAELRTAANLISRALRQFPDPHA